MAKVDKSQLSKAEWKKLKEFRRKEKALARSEKKKKQSLNDIRHKVQEQTKPLEHQPEFLAQSNPKQQITFPKNDDPKIAFVLGNGTSRRPIEPETLKHYGKVYACNAIYRTFDPDYLVAVDTKMILELHKAGYQKKNPNVWTNPNKSLMKYKGFNFFSPSKGWSSGPTALWLASQHGYDKIYILGFDYRGLEDGQKFNNVYADTPNYKKSSDSATFFGNWMRQTLTTIKEHKHIEYFRVIAPDNYRPQELNKLDNVQTILVEDFNKIFKNPQI